MPLAYADYRDMAPRPVTPPPAATPSTPQWVWRDASFEGVVGGPGSPAAAKR